MRVQSNKKINTKHFIVILLLFFSFSCENYIDIDVPPLDQKPVLNCLFTQNQPFKARLSLSMDINDTSETVIEGATVNLFADGEFIEQLADSGAGIYKSDHKAQYGIEYRMEASIAGFETIRATDILPEIVVPENIYYKKNAIVNPYYGDLYTEANLTIKDPAFTDNYYEISLSAKYKNPWYDPNDSSSIHSDEYTFDKDIIAYWIINDPVLNTEDLVGWIGSIPFSDKLFNGNYYHIKLPVITREFSGNDGETLDVETFFYVKFNTVSYHYYKYKSTMDKHLFNQGGYNYYEDNPLLIGAGNPVEMYTNVENGFGIFAAYSSQVISVTDIRN